MGHSPALLAVAVYSVALHWVVLCCAVLGAVLCCAGCSVLSMQCTAKEQVHPHPQQETSTACGRRILVAAVTRAMPLSSCQQQHSNEVDNAFTKHLVRLANELVEAVIGVRSTCQHLQTICYQKHAAHGLPQHPWECVLSRRKVSQQSVKQPQQFTE